MTQDQRSEYMKAWRLKHPDYQKRWKEQHPEAVKEYRLNYRRRKALEEFYKEMEK